MIDLIKNLYIAELKNHIRLSLEYKRSRGEYTGLAPIGYKNIQNQKNIPNALRFNRSYGSLIFCIALSKVLLPIFLATYLPIVEVALLAILFSFL